MNILFKGLIASMVVANLNATTLKEIIQDSIHNNENIKAMKLLSQAKQKTYESAKNIYNPNLIVGVNYTNLSIEQRAVQVGSTTTGFAKLSINLYDGGKNKAFKKQKKYEYNAQNFENITSTKEILLQVVTLFFEAKTTIENIAVYKEKGILLKAQYERIKDKYKLRMATLDEVLKLQSEYESNKYTIDNLEYQKEDLFRNLSLLSGKEITSLDTSKLPDVKVNYQQTAKIKALQESLKANQENINIAKSTKRPKFTIEDSLNFYGYSDYNEKLLSDLPDKQNQFSLSLTYNLFDTSSKHKIESAKLAKLSSAMQLSYVKKQEKMKFILAKKKLYTQQLKINSLKSAVNMANEVYKIIKIKYENGVVDNITYLDALSKKIFNQALYNQSLNDYEIAKANYYFDSGVNYSNIIKKW